MNQSEQPNSERTTDGASGWNLPSLRTGESHSQWKPPPIPLPNEIASPKDSSQQTQTRRVSLMRIVYLLLIAAIALLAANHEKLPGWWAELFYRKPTQEWIRTVALQKMPGAFGMGDLLSFQVQRVTALREAPGDAHVTVTGAATVREPLYETVLLEDAALGLQTEIQSLKTASERSAVLRQRRGIDLPGPTLTDFTFLKQTIAGGQTAQFEFEFKANRKGTVWQEKSVLGAKLIPAGKPIADFPTNAVTQQTEKANQKKAELATEIVSFVAAVNDAENITKNLPILPSDRALPGERFPQTRMGLVNPNELQNWSEENLQYALNEIFARHGAEFRDNQVATWFHQFSWYNPQPNLTFEQIEKWLPTVELQNMKSLGYVFLLKHQETEKKQEAASAERRAFAAQRRVLAAQQERAMSGQRAQQQAAQKAQQDAAAAQAVGGIIQSIIGSIPRR